VLGCISGWLHQPPWYATRSTQPCIPPGSLIRYHWQVEKCRLCRAAGNTVMQIPLVVRHICELPFTYFTWIVLSAEQNFSYLPYNHPITVSLDLLRLTLSTSISTMFDPIVSYHVYVPCPNHLSLSYYSWHIVLEHIYVHNQTSMLKRRHLLPCTEKRDIQWSPIRSSGSEPCVVGSFSQAESCKLQQWLHDNGIH